MFKDKPKDIVRSILPSKARIYARHSGRRIARARRRAVREALKSLPEDWDDSQMWRYVSGRLAKLRSEECWRVVDRREADKLNHLKRWVESQKDKSEGDDAALERISKVIKPAQNIITQHAIEHIKGWLDLKEDQYKYNWRFYRSNQPRPAISFQQLVEILKFLLEHDHAKLNKALKNVKFSNPDCLPRDSCVTQHQERIPLREVWNPRYHWWEAYSPKKWDRIPSEELTFRTRMVLREWTTHDEQRCRRRPWLHSSEEVQRVASNLWSSWSSGSLQGILALASKHGLL